MAFWFFGNCPLNQLSIQLQALFRLPLFFPSSSSLPFWLFPFHSMATLLSLLLHFRICRHNRLIVVTVAVAVAVLVTLVVAVVVVLVVVDAALFDRILYQFTSGPV